METLRGRVYYLIFFWSIFYFRYFLFFGFFRRLEWEYYSQGTTLTRGWHTAAKVVTEICFSQMDLSVGRARSPSSFLCTGMLGTLPKMNMEYDQSRLAKQIEQGS